MKVSLLAQGLSRHFNRRRIFSDLTFSIEEGSSLAIGGRNGAGKSTLLKILAGLLSPSRGSVELILDERSISSDDRFRYLGFVSPYLQLYDEFTAWENLKLFRRLRGIQVDDQEILELLSRLSLYERRDDLVRTFSSGMQQRLKYVFALLHRPPVLLLDEPMSNLDRQGIETVEEIIHEQTSSGLLILASNDSSELKLCERTLYLGEALTPTASA